MCITWNGAKRRQWCKTRWGFLPYIVLLSYIWCTQPKLLSWALDLCSSWVCRWYDIIHVISACSFHLFIFQISEWLCCINWSRHDYATDALGRDQVGINSRPRNTLPHAICANDPTTMTSCLISLLYCTSQCIAPYWIVWIYCLLSMNIVYNSVMLIDALMFSNRKQYGVDIQS